MVTQNLMTSVEKRFAKSAPLAMEIRRYRTTSTFQRMSIRQQPSAI
jgi:hypothetical protein